MLDTKISNKEGYCYFARKAGSRRRTKRSRLMMTAKSISPLDEQVHKPILLECVLAT